MSPKTVWIFVLAAGCGSSGLVIAPDAGGDDGGAPTCASPLSCSDSGSAASDASSSEDSGCGAGDACSDGSTKVPAACSAIFGYLADCSARDLRECAREYGAVGGSARAAIDSYATCAAANPRAGCDTRNSGRWGHGSCQLQQGSASTASTGDAALASLRCVVSADTSSGRILPEGCRRSDGSTFSCADTSAIDYGSCCVAHGEVPCVFSDYMLNLYAY